MQLISWLTAGLTLTLAGVVTVHKLNTAEAPTPVVYMGGDVEAFEPTVITADDEQLNAAAPARPQRPMLFGAIWTPEDHIAVEGAAVDRWHDILADAREVNEQRADRTNNFTWPNPQRRPAYHASTGRSRYSSHNDFAEFGDDSGLLRSSSSRYGSDYRGRRVIRRYGR